MYIKETIHNPDIAPCKKCLQRVHKIEIYKHPPDDTLVPLDQRDGTEIYDPIADIVFYCGCHGMEPHHYGQFGHSFYDLEENWNYLNDTKRF